MSCLSHCLLCPSFCAQVDKVWLYPPKFFQIQSCTASGALTLCRWSSNEVRELIRRRLLFLFYIIRSPFFDLYTRCVALCQSLCLLQHVRIRQMLLESCLKGERRPQPFLKAGCSMLLTCRGDMRPSAGLSDVWSRCPIHSHGMLTLQSLMPSG